METQVSGSLDAADQYAAIYHLFCENRWQELESHLSSIPSDYRKSWLQRALNYYQRNLADNQLQVLVRRIAHHKEYTKFFESIPVVMTQSVFFSNTDQLKTKIAISLYNHHKWIQHGVDYTINIFDSSGKLILTLNKTLGMFQTEVIEIASLIERNVHYGNCIISFAEQLIGSLRIYAYWYNASSITTTHEKGALANRSDIVTFPIIVADSAHDTFLALTNLSGQATTLPLYLFSSTGEELIGNRLLDFAPFGSHLIPVSTLYPELGDVIHQRPVIYAKQGSNVYTYYYFVFNKRTSSWQCQHL